MNSMAARIYAMGADARDAHRQEDVRCRRIFCGDARHMETVRSAERLQSEVSAALDSSRQGC